MTVQLGAKDLVAGYHGAAQVLDRVNLEIVQGRRLALLGANGSGKTTLLKCLSGALTPNSGTVISPDGPLGHDRKSLTRHRQRVQLVLQDPDDQLFAGDVFTDVAFGPTNLGLGPEQVRDRVVEACDLLEISELLSRPVHQLSFGQRKRVAIAGAVAMRPEVLLLDEPTAGLDPVGVKAMRNTLKVLEQHGTTIGLSTHDVQLAWEWADQVAMMVSGRLRVGPTVELLTDDELVSTCRLERPWPVDLLLRLGCSPTRWPRTTAEVAELLGESGC